MDSGTIYGNVHQTGGTMEPGPDPGIITINGNWDLTGSSVVNIEIDGTSNADINNPQFDQVIVTGTAMLAGTLNVTEGGGYIASSGQVLPIIEVAHGISGTFGAATGLTPSIGYWFVLDYGYSGNSEVTLDTYQPTFTVTDTSDSTSDANDLYGAITAADAHTGSSQIDFDISGTAPFTIDVATALPAITQPVNIDGDSEAAFLSETYTTPLIVARLHGELLDQRPDNRCGRPRSVRPGHRELPRRGGSR